jgi:hypothetical protein
MTDENGKNSTSSKYLKLTVILSFILLILLAERLIFNTSDIKVNIEPDHLYATPGSELLIRLSPYNSLNFKNPLGNVNAAFEIESGRTLADIIDATSNSAKIKAKGLEGDLVVGIYSAKTGMLIKRINIKIYGKGLAGLI